MFASCKTNKLPYIFASYVIIKLPYEYVLPYTLVSCKTTKLPYIFESSVTIKLPYA